MNRPNYPRPWRHWLCSPNFVIQAFGEDGERLLTLNQHFEHDPLEYSPSDTEQSRQSTPIPTEPRDICFAIPGDVLHIGNKKRGRNSSKFWIPERRHDTIKISATHATVRRSAGGVFMWIDSSTNSSTVNGDILISDSGRDKQRASGINVQSTRTSVALKDDEENIITVGHVSFKLFTHQLYQTNTTPTNLLVDMHLGNDTEK